MDERNEIDTEKHLNESKNWENLAAEKTDEELQSILSKNSQDYNPAFIIAIEKEIEKRKFK